MTPRDILKLTNNYSISEITVSLIAEPVGEIVYITSIDTSTQVIRLPQPSGRAPTHDPRRAGSDATVTRVGLNWHQFSSRSRQVVHGDHCSRSVIRRFIRLSSAA